MVAGYKNKQGKFIPTGKTGVIDPKLQDFQAPTYLKRKDTMPKVEKSYKPFFHEVPAESSFQNESEKARGYGGSNKLGNLGQVGNPLYLTKPEAYKKWSKDDENWLTDDQIKKEQQRIVQNNKRIFG